MENQPEIVFEGMDTSEALRERVLQELDKLERRYGRIVSSRTVIAAPGHRHQKGHLFEVHLHLTLPGHAEVAVSRAPAADRSHADAHVAVRDAFAAAQQQLQREADQRKRKAKRHVAD